MDMRPQSHRSLGMHVIPPFFETLTPDPVGTGLLRSGAPPKEGDLEMVTMSIPLSAAKALGYYKKENYYQQNSEIGHFHGKGLEALGLSLGQEVSKETFEAALNGFHAQSGQPLVRNAGEPERRAGIDISTFPPKSFSLEVQGLLQNGHAERAQELRDAHLRANQRAMELVEKEFAKAKVWDGERIIEVEPLGVAWATFGHDNTRATDSGIVDPLEHAHNFLLNTVSYHDADGKIRTGTMQNAEIYRAKMLLGQMFRNELAKEVRGLGYDLEVNAKTGFFELAGYSRVQIEEFSGRSVELRKKLEAYELEIGREVANHAKVLDVINAKTKNAKNKLDLEKWQEETKERMAQAGLGEAFFENRAQKAKGPEFVPPHLIQEHISRAAESIIANESVFSEKKLLLECMKHGLHHGFTMEHYRTALVENTTICALETGVYSTHEMTHKEAEILAQVENGIGTQKPLLDAEVVQKHIRITEAQKGFRMTEGQKEFIEAVLTCRDRFMAIRGLAGSGKTFSVENIRKIAEAENLNVEFRGIAFMAKAAEGLEKDSGIQSSTIQKFLIEEEKNPRNENSPLRILILDEAGMVGSAQWHQLQEHAEKTNSRIVFVGDDTQFQSVSAGGAFQGVLENTDIQTVTMSQIMRQETVHMKDAVRNLTAQQAKEALQILAQADALHELGTDESIEAISKEYWRLKEAHKNEKKARDREPLVIASKNDQKQKLNEAIRAQNTNLGVGHKITTKESVNLNGTAAQYARSYEIGMLLQIEGAKRGTLYEVVGQVGDRTIRVRSGRSTQDINVYERYNEIQTFKEVQRDYAANDRIIFSKNIDSRKDGFNVKNGEVATIVKIENGMVTVRSDNGCEKSFDVARHNFFERGYAVTDFKSQGMTSRNVLALADSQMANLNSLYVQTSRATHNFQLFTSNKEELLSNVGQRQLKRSTINYLQKKEAIYEHRKNATSSSRIRESNIQSAHGADGLSGRGRSLQRMPFLDVVRSGKSSAKKRPEMLLHGGENAHLGARNGNHHGVRRANHSLGHVGSRLKTAVSLAWKKAYRAYQERIMLRPSRPSWRESLNIHKITPNVVKEEAQKEEKNKLTPHEERMAFIKGETENLLSNVRFYHSTPMSNDRTSDVERMSNDTYDTSNGRSLKIQKAQRRKR